MKHLWQQLQPHASLRVMLQALHTYFWAAYFPFSFVEPQLGSSSAQPFLSRGFQADFSLGSGRARHSHSSQAGSHVSFTEELASPWLLYHAGQVVGVQEWLFLKASPLSTEKSWGLFTRVPIGYLGTSRIRPFYPDHVD